MKPLALRSAALAYIAPARARSEYWRLAVGILLIILFYFGGITVLAGIGRMFFPEIFQQMQAVGTLGASRGAMIAVLVTFFAMFLAPWLVVVLLHKRGLGTLFGPLDNARRDFEITVLVFLVIIILSSLLTLGLPIREQQYPLGQWLLILPIALVLVLVQVTAEELVFRGYLQQQLGALSDSRLVWWLLPSALFGVLHFDPETFGSNAWLVVAQITLIGLLAADLTYRTGALWAAIGLHFANNAIVMLFLGTEGMLSGLALFLSTYDITDATAMRPLLITELISTLVLMAAYFGYFAWRDRRVM